MSDLNGKECNHSITDQSATMLMVCTSQACTKAIKVGCVECFLKDHIHNDLVEFKRLEEFTSRFGPLKQLADERKKLQKQISSAYDHKMRELQQILKLQRSKFETQLEIVIDGQLSDKIMNMTNGDIIDTAFLRQVCGEKLALSSQRLQAAKAACETLQSAIADWQKINVVSGHSITSEASDHKRERPYQVEESSKKAFKKQNIVQKSINVLADDGITHSNNSLPALTPNKLSENAMKSISTDQTIPLESFQSAINFLQEVQYNSNIDISVDEIHPTEKKSTSLTKFIHGLCRLERVETLHLKIGKSADLVPMLLRKIDESVSCLPKLRQLSLEGWSSDNSCKFASLPETRRRLKNDKQISVVLHKLEPIMIE